MAGEKRFSTSLFGFKKSDVNLYFEKMLREFEDKIKEKDGEITALKNQNRELKAKYDEIAQRTEQVNEERVKIAYALMSAQEKAEIMLEEARIKAADESKKLQQMIEKERERYVEIKEDLRELRTAAINALKGFEMQLNEIIENENSQA